MNQPLVVQRPAKTGSVSYLGHIENEYDCIPPLDIEGSHYPRTNASLSPMRHVLVVLRDPCERFVSAFHYARQPNWEEDWDAYRVLQSIRQVRSAVQWARLLLESAAERASWMSVAPLEFGEPFDKWMPKTHVACHRPFGYVCGFVPMSEYVVSSAFMHYACLGPQVERDISRVLQHEYGRCMLRTAGGSSSHLTHSMPHHNPTGSITTNSTDREGELCNLVSALYPQDMRLWATQCSRYAQLAVRA